MGNLNKKKIIEKVKDNATPYIYSVHLKEGVKTSLFCRFNLLPEKKKQCHCMIRKYLNVSKIPGL